MITTGIGKAGRVVVAHLSAGEDFRRGVEEAAARHGLRHAMVTTCYGTLSRLHVHTVTHNGIPPQEHFIDREGPFEILGLHAIIAAGEFHGHVTVADRDGALGGHVHYGCTVAHMCDVVFVELQGLELERRQDPQTALFHLHITQAPSANSG